jgi:hypothetical protein
MRILLKKSGVANRVPTDSDLQLGELALNFRDGKLYYKHGNGDIRAFIDSSRVETIANAVQVIAQSQLDSAEITQLVDSSYINARLDLSTILDSAEILDLIDSDYIRTAIDEVFTNSFTIDAETLNGESASYYLDYGNFTNTPTILDSAMIQRFTLDSSETIDLIDSAHVRARIDGAFISNLTGVDADTLGNQLPSYYLAYGNFTGTPTILDLVDVRNEIDSAHVQARQIKYNTADFVDSDTVSLVIDSAYVQARQTNEAADSAYVTGLPVSTFTNDANYLDSTTVQGVIDQTYVTDLIDTTYLDSAETIALIDSAYVQLRQTAQDFSYTSLTDVPDFFDSSDAETLIDSAYVQLRQTAQDFSYTSLTDVPDFFDSSDAEILIDSAYVQLRQTAQDFSYTSLTNVPDLFDSSDAETLVDSSYVQARQIQYNTSDFTDSAFVTGLPVSTFTNDTNYLDSTTVQGVIDATYIQSNQTTYNTSDFLDSSTVEGVVDSAYVRARVRTNQDLRTTDSVTFAGLTVSGDLTITGTTTEINTIVYTINDPLLHLADSNEESDVVDIGHIGHYYRDGQRRHTGIFRDASNEEYYIFHNMVDSSFDSTVPPNVINRSATDFTLSTVNVGTLVGVYAGFDSDFTAKSTSDLSEGTNLYYTTARHDSDTLIQVNNAYVQARQIQYNTADFLDSDTVSLVVDSAYVQLRQTSYNTSDFTDSAFVTGLPVSTFTNDANYLDSTTVQDVIDSAYIASVVETDGDINITINNEITSTVDSAYVNARVNAGNFLDSAEAIALIDSAYVQARQTDIRDSAFVTGIVDSAYVRLQTRIGDSDIDFGSHKITYSNVYSAEGDLPDANTYHGMFAHVHATGAGYFAHAGNWVRLANQSEVFDGTYASLTGKPDFFDSNDATILIDSAYVQARTTAGTDSAATIALIEATVDSAYVQLREAAGGGGGGGVDSAATISLIQSTVDSAYVQLRVDSDYITPINQIVYLFTADSGQTAFTDSDDNSQILTFTDAQQLTVFLNGILLTGTDDVTTNASTNTITLTEAADSGDVLSVIKLSGSAPHIDSDMISNVALKFTTFVYTADSGDTSFSGADDNGETLSYTANQVRVHLNGILLIDSADYTATSGTNVSLSEATNAGDIVTIEKMTGRDVGLDSTGVTNLIDSAYVAARTTAGTDSSTVSSIIETDVDSAYVQLRQDFAYASLTGTPTIPALHTDFIDSAAAIRLITANAIDSGVALQLLLDSIETIQLIDSAYVQARQTTYNTSDFLDSTTVTGVIDASYIQSNQITYNTSDFVDSAFVTDFGYLDSEHVDSAIRHYTFQQLNTIGPDDLGTNNYGVYIGWRTAEGVTSSDQFNVHIGAQAGEDVNNTDDNVYVGYRAGGTAGGQDNVAIGADANLKADGSNTVIVGANADATAGTVAIGQQANTGQGAIAIGYHAEAPDFNTAIGYDVGETDLDSGNVIIGYQAGQHTNSSDPGGARNIAIGNYTLGTVAGSNNGLQSEARNNVLIGHQAGGRLQRGQDNIVIGQSNAGSTLNFGNNNIIIGVNAGKAIPNWTATSNVIAIGDSNVDRLMIEGLGIDTQKADSGQVLIWDSSAGQFYFGANGRTYNTSDFADSAYVQSVLPVLYTDFIDSAEAIKLITANAIDSGVALQLLLDSIETLALIDSAYITGKIAGGPLTVDGNGTDNGTIINGGLIEIRTDSAVAAVDFYCEVSNAHRTRVKSAAHADYSGNVDVTLPTTTGTLALTSEIPALGDYLDSSLTTQLIDSSYVQIRVPETYLSTIIDSTYVQARTTAGTDSAATISLIEATVDSAYVQLRQSSAGSGVTVQDEGVALSTAGTTLNFVGSGVTASGTGATKTITISGGGGSGDGLDSALVEQLIDSAYIIARQQTATPAEGLDSATALNLINQQLQEYPNLNVNKFYYTASGSQQQFSGADIFGNSLNVKTANTEVYLNGLLLVDSEDYTLTSTSLTLTDAADSGFSLALIETVGKVQALTLQETKYEFTATAAQQTFSGTDDNGLSLSYTSEGFVDVFMNGVLLSETNDYTTNTAGTTITLTSNADSGDFLTVHYKRGNIVTPTVDIFEFTADSGQTVITGADEQSNTLSFANEAIQVFLNGILLRSSIDYTASGGDTITMTNALDSADDLVVSAFSAPGTYLQKFQFNADSGQTNFSGQDISGEYLVYQLGNTQVFVNGLLQTDSDFSASNGTTITLSNAASANDEVVIHSFSRATNSAPITVSIDSAAVSTLIDSAKTNWSEVSSSITLTNNSKNIVDCSGSALSLNMPGSPTLGDEVRVIDGTASAASNNITISGNGKKIQGDSSDFIIDINRAAVGFVFYNDSNGWLLTEN